MERKSLCGQLLRNDLNYSRRYFFCYCFGIARAAHEKCSHLVLSSAAFVQPTARGRVRVIQERRAFIGTDVNPWPDEEAFSCWLGLSPNHRISGGKVLKRGSRKVVNPLSIALRLAARTLRNSQSALGANFRRLIAKIGMPKAITAKARKLAVLIYRMPKYGTQYVNKGMEHYEAKYRETKLPMIPKVFQAGIPWVPL